MRSEVKTLVKEAFGQPLQTKGSMIRAGTSGFGLRAWGLGLSV